MVKHGSMGLVRLLVAKILFQFIFLNLGGALHLVSVVKFYRFLKRWAVHDE